jgi:HSP20 family molecular chaperone IbpA
MFGEIVQQLIQESLNGGNVSELVQNSVSELVQNSSDWKPLMDMLDNDNEICVYLTLPGVKNSSIDIDILNNRMMISGEREKPYSQNDYQVKRTEIHFGRFQRVITLPISVTNQSSVSTQLKDGILKVKIDKSVEQQNRFSVRVVPETTN